MHNILNKLGILRSQVEALTKWQREGSTTMVNRDAHYQALMAVKDHVLKYVAGLVQGMKIEEVKNASVAGCDITIRKLMADMYSGQIRRGTVNIHQFDRITIPQLAGQLQSLLEMYDPDAIQAAKEPNAQLLDKLKPLADHAENGMVSQLLTILSGQKPKEQQSPDADDMRTEAAAIIAEAHAITDEAKNQMQRVDPRAEIQELKERVEAMLSRVESLVSANAPTSKDDDKTVDTLHQMQQKHDLLTDRVQQELNILNDKVKLANEKLANHGTSGGGKTITITVK